MFYLSFVGKCPIFNILSSCVINGSMDGSTEGQMNLPSDGWMVKLFYRDARTYLKREKIKLISVSGQLLALPLPQETNPKLSIE